MCIGELYSIILQLIAVICSGISSAGIVNLFQIKSITTRVYIIIISAGIQLLVQLIKLKMETRKYPGTNDGSWCCELLWRIPTVNTKQKAVIIGIIGCTFDVMSAMSILYGVDFETADITSYLITLGTLIGFSEEIVELILEIILIIIDQISDRTKNQKLKFHIISFIGTIEIIAALVEVGISMHIVLQLDTDNYDFDIVMISIVASLMGFMVLLTLTYILLTHPRCVGGCLMCILSCIIPKDFRDRYNNPNNVDENDTNADGKETNVHDVEV